MMAKETRMRLFNNVKPCIIIASANRMAISLVKRANPECTKVLG